MVEFHIVALFALIPLCLGILQVGLLLVENHHIDHAAFLAARQGAVKHGEIAEIRKAFAQAAATLFVQSATPLDRGNLVQRVATAYAAATVDISTYARLKVLAPDAAAQADFSVLRDGRRIIPNDSLEYRSATPGSRSRMSLQEANVLRVEISYCRPLIVPFVGPTLLGTLRRLDHDLWSQRCYEAGRIPVRSVGTAPMQSDFRVGS
ncbi:MAG: hypothetical protein ABIP38_11775 [Steroidobacteraceae bacterium]